MIAEMAQVAASHASGRQTRTAMPRLTVWYSHLPTEPTPAMFASKVYMVLAGAKRMLIGNRSIDLAAGDFAVSAVDLPFRGQVTRASPLNPYIGVELALDAAVIAGLLLEAPDLGKRNAPAIAVAQASSAIAEPFARLLRLLSDPADIPMLGSQVERELYYRILQGPSGGTLRQVVQQSKRFHQVETAIRWICDNAVQPMSVTDLARTVGMSATSFHRHFKAVTGYSPLAYQRHVRLLDAQRMLASGIGTVTGAAFSSGYTSPSQFSREYKRLFGVPPNAARSVDPMRRTALER